MQNYLLDSNMYVYHYEKRFVDYSSAQAYFRENPQINAGLEAMTKLEGSSLFTTMDILGETELILSKVLLKKIIKFQQRHFPELRQQDFAALQVQYKQTAVTFLDWLANNLTLISSYSTTDKASSLDVYHKFHEQLSFNDSKIIALCLAHDLTLISADRKLVNTARALGVKTIN